MQDNQKVNTQSFTQPQSDLIAFFQKGDHMPKNSLHENESLVNSKSTVAKRISYNGAIDQSTPDATYINNGTSNGQVNSIISKPDDKPVVDISKLVEASKPQSLFSRWNLRTLKNAYEERPPVEYIVDKLLPAGSLSIVYGAPGSMKSMILADLAACVASGKKWLEPLPTDDNVSAASFATKQSSVLWIDYDNGTRRSDERFEAFGKGRGLSDDTPISYISMGQPWLKADNTEMMNELIEEVKNSEIKMVIIDNLGLISGEADENSADMAPVMGNLRRLAELSGAAVIVIHHQRKGSTADRSGDLLRGHSSIEAALDLALLVARKDQEPIITIKPTKVRGASITAEFYAELTYQHRSGTHDLESARFWGIVSTSKEDAKNSIIANAIKAVIARSVTTGSKLNQSKVVSEAKAYMSKTGGPNIGNSAIRGILMEMEDSGDVISQKGEKNADFYSLPHQGR